VVSRFVEACSADDRVVAAFLCGSRARGEADEYSDLDLCVITRDEAFESVMAERAAFVRQLGEPMFMEDFGLDVLSPSRSDTRGRPTPQGKGDASSCLTSQSSGKEAPP
jgi:hypothetical protein